MLLFPILFVPFNFLSLVTRYMLLKVIVSLRIASVRPHMVNLLHGRLQLAGSTLPLVASLTIAGDDDV